MLLPSYMKHHYVCKTGSLNSSSLLINFLLIERINMSKTGMFSGKGKKNEK
jgi:hypothetical protein